MCFQGYFSLITYVAYLLNLSNIGYNLESPRTTSQAYTCNRLYKYSPNFTEILHLLSESLQTFSLDSRIEQNILHVILNELWYNYAYFTINTRIVSWEIREDERKYRQSSEKILFEFGNNIINEIPIDVGIKIAKKKLYVRWIK